MGKGWGLDELLLWQIPAGKQDGKEVQDMAIQAGKGGVEEVSCSEEP
jgi:hypothetical protein